MKQACGCGMGVGVGGEHGLAAGLVIGDEVSLGGAVDAVGPDSPVLNHCGLFGRGHLVNAACTHSSS